MPFPDRERIPLIYHILVFFMVLLAVYGLYLLLWNKDASHFEMGEVADFEYWEASGEWLIGTSEGLYVRDVSSSGKLSARGATDGYDRERKLQASAVSNDGGQDRAWYSLNAHMQQHKVMSVVIDQQNGQTMYSGGDGFIKKSTDHGATWEELSLRGLPEGLHEPDVVELAQSGDKWYAIVLHDKEYLLYETDLTFNGWTLTFDLGSTPVYAMVYSKKFDALLMGSNDGKVYSFDVNEGTSLRNVYQTKTILDLQVDQDGNVYALTAGSLMTSSDLSRWNAVELPEPLRYGLALAIFDREAYVLPEELEVHPVLQ